MDDVELSRLLAKKDAITSDPQNKASGGIFLYTPKARKKLETIDRDIAHRVRQLRLARGETINDAGYSGRQTNKR